MPQPPLPAYCPLCRKVEVDTYGEVLNTADDRHKKACEQAGCQHPYAWLPDPRISLAAYGEEEVEELEQELPQHVTRLQEIKDQIKELVNEAKGIVQQHSSRYHYERAKGYWLAQMHTALDNEHNFLGDCPCTLQDSIDALDDGEEE